ncbi:movememt protein [Ligustrum leprosis virus]|uniref:movememt protein n=1 Tax=Ligustrum leprosis virus TaxID=2921792 RepID=UPI002483CEDB|nr:movememt protein [Ligustrum leprosis virus]UNH55565.1 movememt protein [Ligustrum leprosis virus]
MSLINSSNAVGADTLHELQDILASDYNEEGLFKTSKSVCIRTDKRFGVGFLTPNDFVSRVVGYVNRKAEDNGLRNVESFRQISDIVGIVTPQVTTPADITLSLVDSCNFASPINDQTVTISNSDGPCVFIFNCPHSIPNSDRVVSNGSETHRRLAIQYEVQCDEAQGAITTFNIVMLWREAFSFRPSFYEVPEPLLIPVKVGYKKAIMVKSHKDLSRIIGRGLITTGHEKKPSVKSDKAIDLTEEKRKTLGAKPIRIQEITDDGVKDSVNENAASSTKVTDPLYNNILRTVVSNDGKQKSSGRKAHT